MCSQPLAMVVGVRLAPSLLIVSLAICYGITTWIAEALIASRLKVLLAFQAEFHGHQTVGLSDAAHDSRFWTYWAACQSAALA